MKTFYTDGSASPNPGPGGWVVLDTTDPSNPHPVALGSDKNTTNIRMEGTAILNAIQLIAKDLEASAPVTDATALATDTDSTATIPTGTTDAATDSANVTATVDAISEIHTDSEFWINVLTKWAPTWAANGWTKKSGPIKNLDLVQALYAAYQSTPVKLIWVKGHAGQRYNELADTWANRARHGATL